MLSGVQWTQMTLGFPCDLYSIFPGLQMHFPQNNHSHAQLKHASSPCFPTEGRSKDASVSLFFKDFKSEESEWRAKTPV